MRVALALLLLTACAELKNQARLGLGGTNSAYAPRSPRESSGAPVQAAVQGTGQAIGAAAVSRVTGGCVAACPPGTTCNPQTGLCDHVPCRGQCTPEEVCVNDRCVRAVPLRVDQKQP